MRTAAKRNDQPVLRTPFPVVASQRPQTPAEICQFVTLRELYESRTVFDVRADGNCLTVQFAERGEVSRYNVDEVEIRFDTQLEARRHKRDLGKLEYNQGA